MPLIEGSATLPLSTELGVYQSSVDQALHQLAEQRILTRIWDGDYTVWKPTDTDISNRLGWLRCVSAMRSTLDHLERFVRDVRATGYSHALLLGMGGSSLAPAMFSHTFGTEDDALQLVTLDSTVPGAVQTYTDTLDPAHTLFLVASKSGTTVETLSLFKHFYNHVATTQPESEVGRHFVAITDPQSPLAELATGHGFREVFLADPHIVGRYAALSHVGLVPAALIGVDLPRLLDHAEQMIRACRASVPVESNPGARLGAILSELTHAGRDKATIVASPSLSALGAWLEQLLAESTGKEGQGIVPVLNEPLGLPDVYGDDRLFIHLALAGDDEEQKEQVLNAISKAGHPVIHLHLNDRYELGGQLFLWQMATAVAGHRLGIHPFDQPDVEAAKQHAHHIIDAYGQSGPLPSATPAASYDDMLLYGPIDADSPEAALQQFLEQGEPGDYVTLQAYLQPPIALISTEEASPNFTRAMQETTEIHAYLLSLCARIRDKYGLAATFGYGPRYLHSTGQQHKGDAGRGLFIQFTADVADDVPIPSEAGELNPSITFGTLTAAEAHGDRQALMEAGRRLIRFHFGSRIIESLHQLNQSLI